MRNDTATNKYHKIWLFGTAYPFIFYHEKPALGSLVNNTEFLGGFIVESGLSRMMNSYEDREDTQNIQKRVIVKWGV